MSQLVSSSSSKRIHIPSKKTSSVNNSFLTLHADLLEMLNWLFNSIIRDDVSRGECVNCQRLTVQYRLRLYLVTILLDFVIPSSNHKVKDLDLFQALKYIEDEMSQKNCECGKKIERTSVWWSLAARALQQTITFNDSNDFHERKFLTFEDYLRKAIESTNIEENFVLECEDAVCSARECASDLLLLYLCQNDRNEEADQILMQKNFKYRLSPEVLRYPIIRPSKLNNEDSSKFISPGPWRNDIPFVQAIDNALPDDIFNHMTKSFNSDSPFWKEHNYSPSTPYFSYVHPLNSSKVTTETAMDNVISYLHSIAVRLFPEAKNAKYAEWWAHCRPHHHGHQLHFDSDNEGNARQNGKPRHPIVSSVLYLDDGCDEFGVGSVGGPTLVTNQRLGDPLADMGWLVHPKKNRYAVFDGSVLHGVIPGRGAPKNSSKRRITFMVAFWKDVSMRPSIDETPGSCRMFPSFAPNRSNYSWHKVHGSSGIFSLTKSNQLLSYVSPVPVEDVWSILGESVDIPTANEEFKDIDFCYSDQSRLRRKILLSKSPSYDECFQGF
ncbi:hypothetical protein HK096_006685 [Nowakowskiella sp. JEL0078]|nr:hypothetical protein HK096_006685 [Nowakowskiella sp. JEL0078]